MLYALNDDDLRVLKQLAAMFASKMYPQGRPALEEPDHPGPEVYIARTPTGGIPGMEWQTGTGFEDKPGYAECKVYTLMYNGSVFRLKPVQGVTKIVYNLSVQDIPGDHWVIITRDKFDSWWVSESADAELGTGTGTAPADSDRQRITVVTNVCPILTSSSSTVTGTGMAPPLGP